MKAKLTDAQRDYIVARSKGMTQKDAAAAAGYAPIANGKADVEDSTSVQEELARIRAEVAKNADITKEEVVQLLVNAAEMARLMADPQGIVAAVRELGKMLGFYNPIVKNPLKGADPKLVKQIVKQMTDEELYAIRNSGNVIEGDFKRLEDKSAA